MLSEFNYVEPEGDLLTIIQYVRTELERPIKITDSTRTVQQHIDIYKNLYGGNWIEKIPWGSRHLPAYAKGLRAIDFKISKEGGGYIPGEEIIPFIERGAKSIGCNVGIGVGKHFIHLDVDRKKNTSWSYDY